MVTVVVLVASIVITLLTVTLGVYRLHFHTKPSAIVLIFALLVFVKMVLNGLMHLPTDYVLEIVFAAILGYWIAVNLVKGR